jgi:hypothetical protein
MCPESGGVGQAFILESDFQSRPFLDLDGGGARGAWIGITTEYFLITRRTLRAVPRFSTVERTTADGLDLRGREDSVDRLGIGVFFEAMRLRVEAGEFAQERSAALDVVECREDFRRAGRAVLVGSMVEGSAEAGSMVEAEVVDGDRKVCGVPVFT